MQRREEMLVISRSSKRHLALKASNHYVCKNGRLALYRERADAAFWDHQWSLCSEETLANALRRSKHMGSLGRFFDHWLPSEGKILEAGCGTAIWVRRFLERGWNCVGLDYAVSSLSRSKRIAPDLPLLGGDLAHLPFPDNYLAAYVSFGVVEHFEQGPQSILCEAYRVLRSGGVALISVPYNNTLRRNARCMDETQAHEWGLEFFQYYYTHKELCTELGRAGFMPRQDVRGYGVLTGLGELSGPFHVILSKLPRPSLWSPVLDLIPGLASRYAHMIFAVAHKP